MGLGKTEWEDVLIEKGIIKAPAEGENGSKHPEITYDTSNKFRQEEITEDGDEIDQLFEEEDNFVLEYKAKQLGNLNRLRNGAFGSIREISRNDFVAEVTEASHKHPVLVYLYQNAHPSCQVLARWLHETAAPSSPKLKFVQIISTRCIPNYPDANLPTILLYRNGALQKQVLQASISNIEELIGQIKEAEEDLVAEKPATN